MNLSQIKFKQLFTVAFVLGILSSLAISSQTQAAERYWIAGGVSSNNASVTDNVAANNENILASDKITQSPTEIQNSKPETRNPKLETRNLLRGG